MAPPGFFATPFNEADLLMPKSKAHIMLPNFGNFQLFSADNERKILDLNFLLFVENISYCEK